MRSVGADEVIDYRRDDFTRTTPAVRPDPGPGRAPVGVRLPACAGARRHVSVRGRVGARAAARAHRRLGGRAAHRSLDRRARREARVRPTSSPLPTSASPGRSGSTSTAPSRSTRFPPRLLVSVRDALSARSLSASPEGRMERIGTGVTLPGQSARWQTRTAGRRQRQSLWRAACGRFAAVRRKSAVATSPGLWRTRGPASERATASRVAI